MALQALALYSEKTAGNALDLRVKLTSEVEVDWKPPEIHFTPENALLRREIDVRIKNKEATSRHFKPIFSNVANAKLHSN